MTDPDNLRLVWQRMDIQAFCPMCGHAMWTIERAPTPIVECVNEFCADAGVKFKVQAPQYALQEIP